MNNSSYFGISSKSRLLNDSSYVFYDTADMEYVKESFNTSADIYSNAEAISKFYMGQANKEFEKEKNLLSLKFNSFAANDYNINDPNIGKILVESFNILLRGKDILKRNIHLILNTDKKQSITYFSSQLATVFNSYSERMANLYIQLENSNLEPNQAAEQMLDQFLPEIVQEALIKSLDPKDGNGEYQKLIDEIKNTFMTTGHYHQMVQDFIEEYKLKNLFTNHYVSSNAKKSLTDKLKNNYYVNVKGGQAAEIMSATAANYALSNLAKHLPQNFSFDVHLAGDTKQKADVIIAINIPDKTIEEWLDTNKENFGTRKEDVQALSALNDKLSSLNEGFLIYSNTKNYMLNGKFFKEKGGFSAGQKLKLSNFLSILDGSKDIRSLTNLALQLPKGAVLHNKENEVTSTMARAISAFLFDDFQIIGQEQSGAQSIHLLDLNGVYVPMSYYFKMLSQTFQDVAQFKKLVDIQIHHPSSVKFKLKTTWLEAYQEQNYNTPTDAWNAQRNESLEQTTIEVHFLRNFVNMIRDLNIEI